MASLDGFRLCIIHHGENLPNRDGYSPLRYGRLAEDLTSQGAHVTRLSPLFNHLYRDWNDECESSAEGSHVLIPTGDYAASMSVSRIRFLRDFVKGSAAHLQNTAAYDAVLVGVPPPGMVAAVRNAVSAPTRLVADVRDIWPDALAAGRLSKLHGPLSLIGSALSQEMRKADTILAVTPAMNEWVPRSLNSEVLPLGMDDRPLPPMGSVDDLGAIRLCFISSHIHGYDFEAVIDGMSQFNATVDSSEHASLAIVGPEVSDELQAFARSRQVSLEVTGRVRPDTVHDMLQTFDAGVMPATKEWGHSLGNKVFDFLAAGLFILHSLEPTTGEIIDQLGFSKNVGLRSEAWAAEITELHQRRADLRSDRRSRAEKAQSVFGRGPTTRRFVEVLTGNS